MEEKGDPEPQPLVEELLTTDGFWEVEGWFSLTVCPLIGQQISCEWPIPMTTIWAVKLNSFGL